MIGGGGKRGASPPPGCLPGTPGRVYSPPPRPPAAIVFCFAKKFDAPIFFLYYPLYLAMLSLNHSPSGLRH